MFFCSTHLHIRNKCWSNLRELWTVYMFDLGSMFFIIQVTLRKEWTLAGVFCVFYGSIREYLSMYIKCVSTSICIYLYLYLSLFVSIFIWFYCIYLYFYLSLFVSISICIYLYLYLSLSLCVYLYVYLCVFLVSWPVCLSTYLPTHLCIYTLQIYRYMLCIVYEYIDISINVVSLYLSNLIHLL